MVVIHPHYIKTVVYQTFHRFFQGGCIIALQRSSNTVAVVAELQKGTGGGDKETLKRLCQWVRKAVLEAEGLKVGLVALAESRSVLKTTSGKVRRWASREQLLAGRMRVAAMVEFDSCMDAQQQLEGEGSDEIGDGVGGGGSQRRVGVTSQEREEIAYLYSSITQTHSRLPSFL